MSDVQGYDLNLKNVSQSYHYLIILKFQKVESRITA